MYLKNLTVLGFKSFADKTSLNFQPGVTAIVGPNGCGKSNVSDAIRWVLGEQSAKALRGGEMADVIFNGTDSRKPLGLAEVSLTIGGVDSEHLQASGVEIAYNEVTLTRRVFKDGGSEYFINKVACRLRDVQQLFMGTGVGRTSYSIMAQGNITQILSSRPDDRRLVFEEAAGITKFKTQKKEALRKLESTDQNLLRVEDLIREVKRQIGSLQRQAGKARRYKQYLLELQHLETQLARHQFDVLQEGIKEKEALGAKLQIEIEVCAESVLRGENEIDQLRGQVAGLDQQISLGQQHGLELKGQSDQLEHRIQFNEERLRELEQQNARALGEINEADERRLVAEQELVVVVEKLTLSLSRLEEHRRTMEERRSALQAVENEGRALQESLRKVQAEAFAATQQLSRGRNEINALDLQKQGNVVRLEKLASEQVQLEEERTRIEVRLQEFSANEEAEKTQRSNPPRDRRGAPATAQGDSTRNWESFAGTRFNASSASGETVAVECAGTIAGRPGGIQRRRVIRAEDRDGNPRLARGQDQGSRRAGGCDRGRAWPATSARSRAGTVGGPTDHRGPFRRKKGPGEHCRSRVARFKRDGLHRAAGVS